jgi:uncharacterized protein YjbI with pentapeptide repeats/energy-coupling factor transporter ATP-binding protein EcfA2
MITPQRALVRPRVIAPVTGQVLPLEDEIRSLVDREAVGLVAIVGPHGCGKTTALRHLDAVIGPVARVTLLDEPSPEALAMASVVAFDNVIQKGLVVYARRTAHTIGHLVHYRLAPWCDDDLIEYLLAAHRGQCPSIMSRLKSATDEAVAAGNPELLCIAMDLMVRDKSIAGIRQSIDRFLHEQFPNEFVRHTAQRFALAKLKGNERSHIELATELVNADCPESLMRALRHTPVQVVLAAESISEDLRNQRECDALAQPFPHALVLEVAGRISSDEPAIKHLKSIVAGVQLKWHAIAASLLHACNIDWRPEPSRLRLTTPFLRRKRAPWLAGAYFKRANWPEIRLSYMDCSNVQWDGANLSGANLTRTLARKAALCRCKLRGAKLRQFDAANASLVGADLTAVHAESAAFDRADLTEANLSDSCLEEASLEDANLTSANFANANLELANLMGATIDDANFAGATLKGACLSMLTLGLAYFADACFAGADLTRCNLEGVKLPGADFTGADLHHAVLTGSVMQRASFRGADLGGTGLAEIDWENADLRDADLRGATFHMGSSRSGKVGSPIASEGSRTGFYTDEYHEQEFKSPEEIRKANLRGADLRGAEIGNVDFYLVDLRGAKYDTLHEQHFRRCRAILEHRV